MEVIQAPGLYQGYEAEVFPGIGQAIRAFNQTEAQSQIEIAAECISSLSSFFLNSTFVFPYNNYQ